MYFPAFGLNTDQNNTDTFHAVLVNTVNFDIDPTFSKGSGFSFF